MKVMVIGGGGREHAIIKSLKKNPKASEIFALPGNGGMEEDCTITGIGAMDLEEHLKFAKENDIDFAVVAPDDPLAKGAVDNLEKAGIKCFGPNQKAAIIEASKAFSKDLMKKYNIPTAQFETFTEMKDALAYVEECKIPIVVKADGLALGKGVIIAQTREEAKDAVLSMMQDKKFGESGSTVVVEEFLEGPEVSVLSFTDGKTLVPMVSSQDHKRALDGDQGLNTGGMGTVAPNPYYTEDIAKRCMEEIFIPTIEAMNKEGRTFKGCLYFGLMLTKDGPKVIEYNCRFGDPETQVVLPLLESDLMEIFEAVADERLGEVEVKFSDKNACCVVMASNGYPQSYEKGFEIKIDKLKDNTQVFVAGAKLVDGKVLTNGGRVLGVTAVSSSLEQAIEDAYEGVKHVHFDNAFFRKDIGQRALKVERR
ncbi:MAG: phosphoribosylamine--glycine ligase [Clostridia bacterium]|nr:phosphoribosylamine--glycine ligase [Clostridia bacterium]